MAIHGTGQGVDITLKASAGLKTTTSQYRAVGIQGDTSSTDWTAQLCNAGGTLEDTATSRYAIGINQTFMSANSQECTIRILGISKAVCGGSISAGDYVRASETNTTTSSLGRIVAALDLTATSDTVTTATITTITPTARTVMGRALESGSTGTVISIFLCPQREAMWTISAP